MTGGPRPALFRARQRSVSDAVARGSPSGPMIFWIQRECLPLLADMPVTVMESPGLRVRLVQPTRLSLFGDVSSPCQGSAAPLSVFASKYTSTFGFLNLKLVTVPVTVTT